jgi:hypothetical protein
MIGRTVPSPSTSATSDPPPLLRPQSRPPWPSRQLSRTQKSIPLKPRRSSASDPANTQWQRDLSISHDKLGDVATAAGDLASADPANTTWQRDLSVVQQKIDNLGKSVEVA